MSDLAAILERDGHVLSQRVLDVMYRDAFWSERFGERGRRHADEDSDFHLRYLARALAAGDGAILVRYATWLREVLATRGMCTRHLDENFRLLAHELAATGWPGSDIATGYLERARQALRHESPDARWVQDHADGIAAALVRHVRARHPSGWKQGDERGPDAGLADDAANYVSYVADAAAFGSGETLVAHARWFAGHLQRHGLRTQQAHAFLEASAAALEEAHAPPRVLEIARQAAPVSRAPA